MPNSGNSPTSEHCRQRRAHKKSRKGCKACKARRTKCDEQGPPCVNCAIRNTDCVYEINGSVKTKASEDLSQAGSSPTTSIASNPSPRNLLELELLFQWSTRTAETFKGIAKDGEDWRLDVTHMALKFGPLLDAIFAISAAHLADDNELAADDRESYINASLEYYAKCCAIFRDEVLNINSGNGRAIMYCSLILIILRLHIPSYGNEDESCVSRVLAAFELLQGTWSIVHVIHDENQGPLGIDHLKSKFKVRTMDTDTLHALDALRQINQLNLDAKDINVSITQQALCRNAIDSLEQWWERSDNKDNSTALVWLLVAPREFISLIRQGNSMARMILLYWSVLFEEVCGDCKWWGRSVGKRLVTELSVILDIRCRELKTWHDARAWANTRVFTKDIVQSIRGVYLSDTQ